MAIETAKSGIGRDNSMMSDSEKPVPITEVSMEQQIDRTKEEALLRKLDLHLIPIIMILYLLSFLDRGKSCLCVT